MLIDAIPKDLDELLQDRSLAAIALLRKFGGVVIVAVDITIVLIVAVLRTEDCGADAACEMLDMVLAIERSYIGAS